MINRDIEPQPGTLAFAIREWEDDNGWEHGTIADDPEARREFLKTWKPPRESNGGDGAKTRARNAAKGVSQKNLTGSTKQKRWATDLRAEKLKAMSEADAKMFYDYVGAAKFWIENRHRSAAEIVERLGVLTKKRDAIAQQLRDSGFDPNANLTPAQADLVDSYNAANNRVSRFLAGEIL
jgi:hypothetical protein